MLKLSGYLFVSVPKDRANGVEYASIEANTVVPMVGPEKGLPHRYFSPEELKAEFYNFDIIYFQVDQINHNGLLGQLYS